jgi:hypothetical protein
MSARPPLIPLDADMTGTIDRQSRVAQRAADLRGNDAASSRWLSLFPVARHLIMSRRLLPTGRMVWLGARGSGSVFARCGCRDEGGGRRGASCPQLGETGHGSWYFSLDLPRHVDGGRRRLRRGGYLTCDAAVAERDRLSIPQPGDPGGRVLTVADWLETWVETRVRLRDSTRRIYRGHIRQHLRRLFDGVLLSELHVGHVEMAFRRLFNEGMIPATARRLFSTLRTALNAAARERLIPDNPARYVKLPRGARLGPMGTACPAESEWVAFEGRSVHAGCGRPPRR